MPAEVRDVRARTDIVTDGNWPDELSLITQGFACRYKLLGDGMRQIMAFLIPGDICDLRALLTEKMDHAVAALDNCRIASISRQKIFDAMEKYPRIELALWRDTMLDAALYRQWLINLGRRNADQRIAHLFCEIWTRVDAIGRAQDATCDLPLTQTDLADALGFSVVHVNKSLRRLREDGLITFRANQVRVHDWERLGRLQRSTLPICNFVPSHQFSPRTTSKLRREPIRTVVAYSVCLHRRHDTEGMKLEIDAPGCRSRVRSGRNFSAWIAGVRHRLGSIWGVIF